MIKAGKAGDWSDLVKSDRLSAWTSAKLQECHSEVKQDDERNSIVQQIQQRTTVPVEGQGWVTLSFVCPHCHRYPVEDYIWWVSTKHVDGNKKKKQCNRWCAACGGR